MPCDSICQTVKDFYPRPPRGGRRGSVDVEADNLGISIHALREEGDLRNAASLLFWWLFLSTPSARRATSETEEEKAKMKISIHALREEGDPGRCPHRLRSSPISIHALREEGDYRR